MVWMEVSPRYFTKSLAYGLEARLFRKDTAWVFLVVEPTKRQLLRERLYYSESDPWMALDEADCLVERWETN